MNKVLLVDDEMTMRLLLRESLLDQEFDVIEAENGEQAVRLFLEQKPDIVLTDVQMPIMDGYQLCQKIRSLSERGALIPILMVTGLEDVDSIQLAYDAGATSFITKPINWALLPHTVLYMLRSAKAVKEQIKSEKMLRLVLDSIPTGVFWKDKNLRFMGSNRRFETDLGHISKHKLIGKTAFELSQLGYPLEHSTADELAVIKSGDSKLGYEEHWKTKTGESRCLRSNRVPIFDLNNDQVIGILGSYEDITKHKRAEQQILFMAQYDSLTGLPNRALFMDRINHAKEQAERTERLLGVMFLDLDRFKTVNDSLGHQAGDQLLMEVAKRLTFCLRQGDTVARLGGDEFTILVERLSSVHACIETANKILNVFDKPFMVAEQELHITTSIGISIFPFIEGETQALLKTADIAMYEAKKQGRNRYCVYDISFDSQATKKLVLETDLHSALDNRQFELWYQPQYNPTGDKIIGVEALIRWRHPERGLISPIEFIPALEETGLIGAVGTWILQTACFDIQELRDQGLEIGRVAVNLSPIQFNSPLLSDCIQEALLESQLPPEVLELEITEGSLMKNQENAISMLEQLKELGIKMAIDDFGTGYSSLSYLKQFPLDALKIDQSFVKNLPNNEDDKGIVRAIIALSKSLGLRIISEGIENAESLAFLAAEGSDEMQGYYLSRPIPKNELALLLKKVNG